MFSLLLVYGLLGGQNLPSWAYHSPISAQQRIAAVAKLQAMLDNAARKDRTMKRADALLREACIVEPLGEDSKGADAIRIIAAPKGKPHHHFSVMAVYAPDAKASTTLRQMIHARPTPALGLDTEQPLVYIRMDGPSLKKWLPRIAQTIIACADNE